MLLFGGLLSLILQGGAAGLNQTNPGIVKVLGGAVFPVGLIMWAQSISTGWSYIDFMIGLFSKIKNSSQVTCWLVKCTKLHPIIGYQQACYSQYFPMAVLTRAIPFWSLCLNWTIGLYSVFPFHFSASAQ